MTDQCVDLEEEGGWGALDDLPGNPMMWILIISELAVFGAFFLIFAGNRLMEPDLFAQSQAQLSRLMGGLNTIVLVTSGYFAARAVPGVMRGNKAVARRWLVAASAGGALFLGLKFSEYADKAAVGIGIETNSFFTLFYLLTGFHALHVVFGLFLMGIAIWRCSVANVITITAFWHMVDLIWVILYPVVYLMR